MKPAIKIERDVYAQICLVTTEDGLIGFTYTNEAEIEVLKSTDFSKGEYKYLPALFVPEIRALGSDWETVYAVTIH